MIQKVLCAVLSVLLAAGVVWATDGTWLYPVPTNAGLVARDIIIANDANNLTNVAASQSDGSVFIPANNLCVGYENGATLTMIPTPVATPGLWALARTAAGTESYSIRCPLDSALQRTTSGKGIKITSLGVVYHVVTSNLTAATFKGLVNTTFTDNAAVATSTYGTATIATSTTANPRIATVTIAAPAYFPTAVNATIGVEMYVSMANGGTFRLYGVQVSFTRTDY